MHHVQAIVHVFKQYLHKLEGKSRVWTPRYSHHQEYCVVCILSLSQEFVQVHYNFFVALFVSQSSQANSVCHHIFWARKYFRELFTSFSSLIISLVRDGLGGKQLLQSGGGGGVV